MPDTTPPPIETIPAAGLAEVKPLLLDLLAEDQRHYGEHRADRSAIAGLVGDVGPAFQGENLLLGARVDGALVAFCWLVFYDPGTGYEAEVAEVYVHPDQRGKGLARAMIRRAVEIFRERGITFASVWTHPDNSAAVKLYHEAGFAPTEQLVLTWLPDGR